MQNIEQAIQFMQRRIAEILAPDSPSIYLYGSAALGDFRPGWSDIDLLVLTQQPISPDAAEILVNLRQNLPKEPQDIPLFRAFEGGMLPLTAFLNGSAGRVVYWGTSGQRISDSFAFSAFDRLSLIDHGILLNGKDVRAEIPRPTHHDLYENARAHEETISIAAEKTGRSLYSFGWLLDISRCLYTLRTGRIIAKTAAGEWALREQLCPCPDALEYALTVRKSPLNFRQDPDTMDYAETLHDPIRRYADVLARALAEPCFSHCDG